MAQLHQKRSFLHSFFGVFMHCSMILFFLIHLKDQKTYRISPWTAKLAQLFPFAVQLCLHTLLWAIAYISQVMHSGRVICSGWTQLKHSGLANPLLQHTDSWLQSWNARPFHIQGENSWEIFWQMDWLPSIEPIFKWVFKFKGILSLAFHIINRVGIFAECVFLRTIANSSSATLTLFLECHILSNVRK